MFYVKIGRSYLQDFKKSWIKMFVEHFYRPLHIAILLQNFRLLCLFSEVFKINTGRKKINVTQSRAMLLTAFRCQRLHKSLRPVHMSLETWQKIPEIVKLCQELHSDEKKYNKMPNESWIFIWKTERCQKLL